MIEEQKMENEDLQESKAVAKSEEEVEEKGDSILEEKGEEGEVLQEDEELDMESLYAETLKNIEEGEVVKGTIIRIDGDTVLVDVGFKSEGSISLMEFKNERGEASIQVGDEVNVFLEETENNDGYIVLSKEKAERIQVWEEVSKAFEEGKEVEGRIVERIKGGLSVDVGVKAFLPGSQVDIRPVRDLDSLIGKTFRMRIIKLNRKKGNIVLSRRDILEKERAEKKKQILAVLDEGQIVKGVVKNITEYGAFIDLGGIDGLLHITDMSWGRVSHPSELFMIGDEVEVVVLKYDREKERVSLGFKQKTVDPWEKVDEKYPISSQVRGKVVSLTDYGAFIELEKGVEGLVHISEMCWTRKVRHPSKIVAIGDTVEAVVLNMDKENKRISLGMKQIEPNPWNTIEEKCPIGALVCGRVRNVTDFGAFIGLEEGIDGLVHISDMSWTEKIKHPSEVLKKGQKIDTIVLNIDKEKERLSLGIKQLVPDPWEKIKDFAVGSNIKVTVAKIVDFGLLVDLVDDVKGLIHTSELSKKKSGKEGDTIKVGDKLIARIMKIDPSERKIALSIKACEEELEKNEIEEYISKQETGDINLGGLLAEAGKIEIPVQEESETEPEEKEEVKESAEIEEELEEAEEVKE